VIFSSESKEHTGGLNLSTFGLDLALSGFSGFTFEPQSGRCSGSFEAGETQSLPTRREIAVAAGVRHLSERIGRERLFLRPSVNSMHNNHLECAKKPSVCECGYRDVTPARAVRFTKGGAASLNISLRVLLINLVAVVVAVLTWQY
jgi:hypothetical protein